MGGKMWFYHTKKIEKVVFVNATTKQNSKWKHLNPTTFFRWKMNLKAIGIPQAWVVSKRIEGCSKTHDDFHHDQCRIQYQNYHLPRHPPGL